VSLRRLFAKTDLSWLNAEGPKQTRKLSLSKGLSAGPFRPRAVQHLCQVGHDLRGPDPIGPAFAKEVAQISQGLNRGACVRLAGATGESERRLPGLLRPRSACRVRNCEQGSPIVSGSIVQLSRNDRIRNTKRGKVVLRPTR